MRLLVIHGANINDDSRPFEPSLHLACLLKSKASVELLLEKGADLNTTAGFFEKTIFAAIQKGQPNIVALLLQKGPLTEHTHPEYTSPLHLACAMNNVISFRKLLEYGANAHVLDAKGRTPLTIALEKGNSKRGIGFEHSRTETFLDVILKRVSPLHILDDDFTAAVELNYEDAKNKLASVLDIAKGMIVSEAAICQVLKSSFVDNQIIELFMQRSGRIGVTAKMLKAVRTHHDLEMLLQHKPVCRITPRILESQKTLECMELLLDIDPETTVTEEVIFRALEIGIDLNRKRIWSEGKMNDVLETLFDRNPDIAVTQDMFQAVRYASDLEILLKRLEPGTHIITNAVATLPKIRPGEVDLTLLLLLKFDPSIRLVPKMTLQTLGRPNATEALEMLLEHDPSMHVTEELFVRICKQFPPPSTESDRENLADLMRRCGTRLVFTDKVREVIDHAYQRKRRKRSDGTYSLIGTDAESIEPVDKSTNERTPEDEFLRKSK